MGFDALIPKAGPAEEDDKTPESIKNREEEEANGLATGEGGSEHPHHVPSTMQIDHGETDPGDSGESRE